MPAKAPARPPAGKGKGLNGKVGPVPVKVLLALGIALAGYLLYRHYKGSQTTSAGSGATPTPSSTLPAPSGDSTGGGGATSVPDQTQPSTPSSFPPIFNFSFSQPAQDGTLPSSGGNVSTPTAATGASSSQPLASFSSVAGPSGGSFGSYPVLNFTAPDAAPSGPAATFTPTAGPSGGSFGSYPVLSFGGSRTKPATTKKKATLPPIGGRGHIT